MLVYFWERERETQSVSKGRAQRERETQNPKQAPKRNPKLSAQSPMLGSNPRALEIMTRAEVKHPTDWATQAPPLCFYLIFASPLLCSSVFFLQLHIGMKPYSICLWLILLSIIHSGSIHIVANGKISFFLIIWWHSVVCIPQLPYPFISRWTLQLFPYLGYCH